MPAHRILFFSEAVTLAHLGRPLALAQGLDGRRYEIVLACDRRYQSFLDAQPFQTLPLHSIPSPQFLQALAKGAPLYDAGTLQGYVKEDLQLIESTRPDLIVGDFRLSLSVSARLAGVPYVSITNAYWSPYYAQPDMPLPVLPFTRLLPLPLAQVVFRLGQPVVMPMHCAPLNRVRRENGLASLGSDLRRVYTDADHCLYADAPELFPTVGAPPSHRYVGPVLWSPPVSRPPWWLDVPDDKPLVYLTLGSSGAGDVATRIVRMLGELPVNVLAASAGTSLAGGPLPSNVWLADYLPGTECAARSRLVICNGGSPTSAQALAAGVPVLGVASNMDQFLNMRAVAAAGAGKALRADRIGRRRLCAAVEELLQSDAVRSSASSLAPLYAVASAPRRFAETVDEILASGTSSTTAGS